VQVFLKFSTPWWTFTREQGNRAVPIRYGNLGSGRKAGATGITDNKMAQVVGNIGIKKGGFQQLQENRGRAVGAKVWRFFPLEM
jgi:hypothetical protein